MYGKIGNGTMYLHYINNIVHENMCEIMLMESDPNMEYRHNCTFNTAMFVCNDTHHQTLTQFYLDQVKKDYFVFWFLKIAKIMCKLFSNIFFIDNETGCLNSLHLMV